MKTDPVNERVRFISAWLSREESVSALAIRFGVSRTAAYKWIGRYAAEGPAGLAERTSAPVTQAARTPPKIVAAVLKLRRKHPAWGPRKLRARLQLDDPTTSWPAASTIGDILKRAGLVRPRKLRRRVPQRSTRFVVPMLRMMCDASTSSASGRPAMVFECCRSRDRRDEPLPSRLPGSRASRLRDGVVDHDEGVQGIWSATGNPFG